MSGLASEVLQRRILLFSAIAVALTGLVVSAVGLWPMSLYSRQLAAEKVEHVRTVTALAVGEYARSLTAVAQQVTSRTQIRIALEEYLDGTRSRDDLVAFSAPRLRDAYQISPQLLGILRRGPDGQALIQIGEVPPLALRPTPAADGAVVLAGPLLTAHGPRLAAGAPLSRPDGRPLGSDITLFAADALGPLLTPPTNHLVEVETFLAVPGPDGPYWLRRDGASLTAEAPPVPIDPAAGPGARVTRDAHGAAWVVASGPVPSTPWFLVVVAPGEVVFAEGRSHLLQSLAATAALVLAGALGLLLLLRPLAGHMLIRTRELQDQVEHLRVLSRTLEEERRRLAESNHELEEFASAASHDLQQPLRMISGFLDLLRRRYGERLDDEGREYLAFASDGAQRLTRMVRGLLDYARTGRGPGRQEAVPFAALLDQTTANLQTGLTESGAVLTTDAPPGLMVRGEPTLLLRLFQNLIDNALKYRHPSRPARVLIQVRPLAADPERVEVMVRDNGIGIPSDQMGRIFQLFHRVNPDSGPEGTGLGLALCQKIVALHGGVAWAAHAPTTPDWGGGLEIHFTLPMADGVDTAGAAPSPTAIQASPGHAPPGHASPGPSSTSTT